jgi:hypothetical protein
MKIKQVTWQSMPILQSWENWRMEPQCLEW